MIQRWKAFYERGLSAGVRAAGVEQMRPSDQDLRQARRDLAENAERIARKGPTQPRLDLQRQIEARIAELEKPRFQFSRRGHLRESTWTRRRGPSPMFPWKSCRQGF